MRRKMNKVQGKNTLDYLLEEERKGGSQDGLDHRSELTSLFAANVCKIGLIRGRERYTQAKMNAFYDANVIDARTSDLQAIIQPYTDSEFNRYALSIFYTSFHFCRSSCASPLACGQDMGHILAAAIIISSSDSSSSSAARCRLEWM